MVFELCTCMLGLGGLSSGWLEGLPGVWVGLTQGCSGVPVWPTAAGCRGSAVPMWDVEGGLS